MNNFSKSLLMENSFLMQGEFTHLAGCAIIRMRPIFKTKIFIYESKAKSDVKTFFGKIIRPLNPRIRTMSVRGMYE